MRFRSVIFRRLTSIQPDCTQVVVKLKDTQEPRTRRYAQRPCILPFVVRIPHTLWGTTRKEIQFWKNFRGLLYFLLHCSVRGLLLRRFLPSVGGAAEYR
jgi:hypothetical protein